MTDTSTNTETLKDSELEDLVASTDTGGRSPDHRSIALFMAAIALIWSVWQIWIASPLPYLIGAGVFSGREARPIHLGFAIFLAFLAYPAFKNSPRHRIPVMDWSLAVIGTLCALYIFIADSSMINNLLGTR